MPWLLPENKAQRLALAKGYPFDAPSQSFFFHLAAPARDAVGRAKVAGGGGPESQVQQLVDMDPAPRQLARKFDGPEFARLRGADPAAAEQIIPVTYLWLQGYDVVYSAHVTRYGAIASNLTRRQGCRVRVAVTWLTDLQLHRMHATEGRNYPYGWLKGVAWECELPGVAPVLGAARLHVYKSQHGCLADATGEPLSMAAIAATGRCQAAASQEEALDLVRQRHYGGEDLDSHILANIADPARRARLTAALAREAVPSQMPHFRPL